MLKYLDTIKNINEDIITIIFNKVKISSLRDNFVFLIRNSIGNK